MAWRLTKDNLTHWLVSTQARGEAAREAQRQRDEMAIEAERLREEAERLREESEAARDAVRLRHEMEEKLRRAEHDRQAQLKNLKKQMQETAERKRNQENQAQREELARLRAMMARRTGEVPDALWVLCGNQIYGAFVNRRVVLHAIDEHLTHWLISTQVLSHLDGDHARPRHCRRRPYL